MIQARWKTLLLGLLLAGLTPLQYVAAVPGPKAITRPVGFTQLTAPANSDVNVSPCFTRPSVYSGAVASLSGSIITVAGSPTWTNNSWVLSAPTQPETYYVQFKSGSASGRCYTIVANAAQTLTIDWNGETPAAAVTDTFIIAPYWTLGTLFPATEAGTAFTASASESARETELVFIDQATVGINPPVSATYYFFNNTWRKVGDSPTNSFDGTVVAPGSYIIQRNKTAATALWLYGRVPTGLVSTVINAQGGTAKQDNTVSLSFPLTITLDSSNLHGSGAFDTSPSSFVHTDELYVFDNTASGIKKAAASVYYYYNGAWRKVGAPVTSDFGATAVFVPGTGVIVRKSGSGSSASETYWTYTSPVN